MSALAKAVLAYAARCPEVAHGGFVHIPEEWWAKWQELARRETKAAPQRALEHGPACLCIDCRLRRQADLRSPLPMTAQPSGQRGPKAAEGAGAAGRAEQPASQAELFGGAP